MSILGSINWVKVTEYFDVKWLKKDKWYLVKTNGGEWRDTDLIACSAWQVESYLHPRIVRGRPIAIAEINEPNFGD